ncbi:uncharacterized protein [Zea mays]|uniref:uncharacterized protein n=1 Tax=Zea mays TaxID=4577 RepID=UPI0004DEBA97|nr:uncharacterized protein LOC103627492 [Zea mays]|eukprot:XP_008646005.1 uncharacterized protein LOC103627492 [Zea mays]
MAADGGEPGGGGSTSTRAPLPDPDMCAWLLATSVGWRRRGSSRRSARAARPSPPTSSSGSTTQCCSTSSIASATSRRSAAAPSSKLSLFPWFDLRIGWKAEYVLPEIHGAVGAGEPAFSMNYRKLHASIDRVEAIVTQSDRY